MRSTTTANLPNYTCIKRRAGRSIRIPAAAKKGYRFVSNEVQEVLTFFDKKETYQVQVIDGKAVKTISHESTGRHHLQRRIRDHALSHLRSRHRCGIRVGPLGQARRQQQHVRVRVSHPRVARVLMLDGESHREYTSAYKGLVYADHTTKTIQRVTLETVDVPADFPIQKVEIKLDYALTDISGQKYISARSLPADFADG